jgi:protocatechuate 3,4-dioxygenase beta subunit/peroxiredoxin
MPGRCMVGIWVALVAAAGIALGGWADVALDGQVFNASGDAVSGATVSVFETDRMTRDPGERIAAQSTDDSGRFAVTLPRQAASQSPILLVTEHPDHGVAWKVDWGLFYGNSQKTVNFVLPERATLAGKVTDSSGKPVVGATVSPVVTIPGEYWPLGPLDGPLNRVTGPDGTFLLEGLPEGAKAALKVTHPEYATAVVGAVEARGRFYATLDTGQPDAVVALEPEGVITGKVIDAKGNSVTGAEILCVMEKDSDDPDQAGVARLLGGIRTKTNARGVYSVEGLPEGTFSLQCEAAEGVAAAIRSVKVTPGDKVTGQDFALSEGVRVAGRFEHAETGEPVAGASVWVTGGARRMADTRGLTVVDAGDDGTFEFRDVAGEEEIIVDAQFVEAGHAPDSSPSIKLEPGQDRTDIVFKVEPWVAFKGRVVDSEQNGVAGAEVFNPARGAARANTGPDGAFELPLVRYVPREYAIVVLEACHPDLPERRGFVCINLQSAECATGDIVLRTTGAIHGRVVDASGRPIKGAEVAVQHEFRAGRVGRSNEIASVVVDESGTYEAEGLVPGVANQISATARGYGQDRQQGITIEPGKAVGVPDLVLDVADMTLSGTLTDEDGAPVGGVRVSVYGNSTVSASRVTAKDGRFTFESVVDEEIQLSAWHQANGESLRAELKALAGDQDVELVLSPSSSSADQQEAARLIGKEAPDLRVAYWAQGGMVNLASLRGKPVVLAFWDSTQETAPAFAQAITDWTASHEAAVQFVAIHSPTVDRDQLKGAIADLGIRCRVGVDTPIEGGKAKGSLAKDYRARRVSAVYIIDAEGNVAYQDVALPAVDQALELMLDKTQK